MNDNFIITIDGPAGAGKSTIAKTLAGEINFKYVDTGAMYRAITLKIIENEIPFSYFTQIEKLTENTDITIDFSNSFMFIYLDGKNVTDEIRCDAVTENTSLVAAIPAVRNKLAGIQRLVAKKLVNIIFEGRDMGTIVFPNANLKIYLDAGIEERAKRRWQELDKKGIKVNLKELKEKIEKRDRLDASRGLAPLRIPEDAYVLDSTYMSIEEVVKKIVALLDL